MLPLEGKKILVTGGTGSLGQLLVKRLLGGELGRPSRVVVFSRDEAKQHAMRVEYMQKQFATDEAAYQRYDILDFVIGDVRDQASIASALSDVDVVFNSAALKQVPSCEYFPYQAVMTNILGAENIVRAIEQGRLGVQTVVGISTDKACKPVNVMGMTKAIQERVFIQASMRCPQTRFLCVRYGNVLASRGSVVPLFLDQIAQGGPITITTTDMTRFLLSLDQAVDTVFAAVRQGQGGDTFIPIVPSALVVDVAAALVGDRPIPTIVTGVRPGEKIHEILVSEEELHRTVKADGYYVILPMLPEIRGTRTGEAALTREYSSADQPMDRAAAAALLARHGFVPGAPSGTH